MKKDWFKARGYIHLTDKIREGDRSWVFRLVRNDEYIGRKHAFFPLLRKEVKTRRFKKCIDRYGHAYRGHVNQETGKSNTKIREIEYATHLDSQIFAWYRHLLTEQYEKYLKTIPGLSDCILAYRGSKHREPNGKGKTNVHFARDLIVEIKNRKPCAVLTFDVERFFPSLDHQYLKYAWASLLNFERLPANHYAVFKATTKYSFIRLRDLRQSHGGFNERKLAQLRRKGIEAFFESGAELRQKIKQGNLRVFKNRRKGIPHGLPISAMLANLYMLKFDHTMLAGIVNRLGGTYRRYSDDIVIICNPDQISEVQQMVAAAIQDVSLTISTDKSEVFLFRQESDGKNRVSRLDKPSGIFLPSALTYLGLTFNGEQAMVKRTVWAKYHRRLKRMLKSKQKILSSIQTKELLPHLPVRWSRKIRMAFSSKGAKVRKVPTVGHVLQRDGVTGIYRFVKVIRFHKKWGNTMTYLRKAKRVLSEIWSSPDG